MFFAVRDRLAGLACAVLCAFAVLTAQRQGAFERIEQAVIDWRIQFHGEAEPGGRVAVIGITQQCINQLGPLPWTATPYAEALARLAESGAQTVALDVFVNTESETPHDPGGPPPPSHVLADAMTRSGNVALPVRSPASLARAPVLDGVVHVGSLQRNAEILERAAAAIGHVNVHIDTDGTVRRAPAMLMHDGRPIPKLSLVAVALHRGDATVQLRMAESLSADLGWVNVPLSHESDLYTGPIGSGRPDTFFAFSDLLEGRIPADKLAGRLVFVGHAAPDTSGGSAFATPLGYRYGVFVQAGLADALLNGRSYHRSGTWSWLPAPLMALLAALVMFGGGFRRAGLGFASLAIGLAVLGQWLFARYGVLVEMVPAAVVLVGTFAAALAWLSIGARRRAIQNDTALRLMKETGQVVNLALLGGKAGAETPHLRIAEIGEFMSNMVEPEKSPAAVIESLCAATGARMGTLYVRVAHSGRLELAALHEIDRDSTLQRRIAALDRAVMQRVEADGLPLLKGRIERDSGLRGLCPEAQTALSVPLPIAGGLAGIVNLYSKRPARMNVFRPFEADDLRLASTMAHQAALALHNAQLYQRMRALFRGAVTSLAAAIDAKDPYTRGHSERVARYSRRIAEALGLTPPEVEAVELTAMLHDVGKIAVRDIVLTKPGRLSEAEWAMLREHPARGVDILRPIEALRALWPGIRHHHERFDGQGYPDGLSGEAIPLVARILCVADSFDAMTSDRSYRRSLGYRKATDEIAACAGAQFDAAIANAFLQTVLGMPADTAAAKTLRAG